MLTLDYLSDDSYQNLFKLYGIDRTEFIHDILTDSRNVLCFLKPKGFLQSILLTMLADFLDVKQNLIIDAFFRETAISKFSQSAAEQGNWPVIYFDLSGLTEFTTTDEFDHYLNQVINHYYEKYEIEKYKNNGQPLDTLYAWLSLIKALYSKYKCQCYLIINGVDEPFHFEGMKSIQILWMDLLANTVKSNPYVKKVVLCGVMRPGTYAVDGALNNYYLYDSVHFNRYNEYFSITVKEAESIAKVKGLDEQTVKQLKKLSGGYYYRTEEMIQADAVLTQPFSLIRSCQYPYLNQILKNPGLKNWLNALLDSYKKQKPITFYFDNTVVYCPMEQPHYRDHELLSLLVLCGFLAPVTTHSKLFKIPNRQRYLQVYQCLTQEQIKTPQMIIREDFFAKHSYTLFAQKTLTEKQQFVIAKIQDILMHGEKSALQILPLINNDEELEKAYTEIKKFYS